MDSSIGMDALFAFFNLWRKVGQNDTDSHIENRQLHQKSLEFNNEKENSFTIAATFTNFILITAKFRKI